MRVLYSFWGFITPLEENSMVNTPDGERGNRVDFVNELMKRGHTPIQLQKMRDDKQYPGVEYDDSGFPDGDLLMSSGDGLRGRIVVRTLQSPTTLDSVRF